MAQTKVTMGGAKEVKEEVVVEEPVKEVVEPEPELVEDDGPTRLEDVDPNEELWPGGPTVGQILEWKELYGNVYVTSVSNDNHIVWRTIDRGEYTDHVLRIEELVNAGMTQAQAEMYNEEVVAEMCILYPHATRESLAKGLAGVPAIIHQEVMDASGFRALEIRQL